MRHCLSGAVLGTGVHGAVGQSEDYLTPVDAAKLPGSIQEDRNKSMESFRTIFREHLWIQGRKPGPAVSGDGSTPDFAVDAVAGLHTITTEIKARLGLKRVRILDVPCGDMQWMPRFLTARDDIDYVGMDIVPELIEGHQKTFVAQPWKFMHYDILRDGLKEKFDIIHCRMMLQHLLLKDLLNFLLEFSKSGSRYLITTTFPDFSENTELNPSGGRFRYLNLEAPPVSLVNPLCHFRDGPVEYGAPHILSVWKLPLKRIPECTKTSKLTFPAGHVRGNYYACGNWSV